MRPNAVTSFNEQSTNFKRLKQQKKQSKTQNENRYMNKIKMDTNLKIKASHAAQRKMTGDNRISRVFLKGAQPLSFLYNNHHLTWLIYINILLI